MKLLIIFLFTILICLPAYSQPTEMSQDEWEIIKDDYAVKVIILMSHLDSLNAKIDSLKNLLSEKETALTNCSAELYSLLGTTETEVAEYRIKFGEAERKINSKQFTPGEEKSYYDEIASSNLRCLPEFSNRFASLRKKLETPVQTKIPEGNYIVVKGDCLWQISEMKLGNALLWPAIWNVNRAGVLNKNVLPGYSQRITNPDLIYPGQELKIPSASESEILAKESLKELRKRRLRHKNQ